MAEPQLPQEIINPDSDPALSVYVDSLQGIRFVSNANIFITESFTNNVSYLNVTNSIEPAVATASGIRAQGSAPGAANVGDIYYNLTTSTLQVYNGTAWVNTGSTVTADQVYFAAAGNLTYSNVQASMQQLDSIKMGFGGGTMTGPLILSGAPAVAQQAASKAYVDAGVAGAQFSVFTGGGNISTGTISSAIFELDTEKVSRLGDTMLGDLTLPNLTATNNVFISAANKLRLSGGNPGDVLSTDGAAGLSWVANNFTALVTWANVTMIGNVQPGFADNLVQIAPNANAPWTSNGQYLQIWPRTGTNAIHLQAATNGDLVLGDTSKFVVVDNDGNIRIQSNDGTARTWHFYGNGLMTAPGNLSVSANISGGNMSLSGNANAANLHITANANIIGNANIGNAVVSGQVVATGNVVGGNLRTTGLVLATGNVTGGNITTAGQVVATSNVVGGNLRTTGLVLATGNVTGGNITTAGQVVATGNVIGSNLITTGNVAASQLQSTVAVGTAPLTVISNTKVTNLNSEMVGNYKANLQYIANTVAVRDLNANLAVNALILENKNKNSAIANGQLIIQKDSVAVGANAGNAVQQFYAVAVGFNAGGNGQGNHAVAVGANAQANSPGFFAIAIGANAGFESQTTNSVMIGSNAGTLNVGAHSIGIGHKAAENGGSFARTIVLNADSTALNPTQADSLFVHPIRQAANSNVLVYNSTTREISVSRAQTHNSVAVTTDFDLNAATWFYHTITAATTFTVSNVAASGTVNNFKLELTDGGAFPITWWATINWTNGVVPTLTTSGVDILEFYTRDGGATWRGWVLSTNNS